jgi:hypothetical protein
VNVIITSVLHAVFVEEGDAARALGAPYHLSAGVSTLRSLVALAKCGTAAQALHCLLLALVVLKRSLQRGKLAIHSVRRTHRLIGKCGIPDQRAVDLGGLHALENELRVLEVVLAELGRGKREGGGVKGGIKEGENTMRESV